MKLPIIIVAGTLTAAVAYNAYALTCGAQPSCADLGYTLTSSADCLGTVLKCPFDKKYSCVTKSNLSEHNKTSKQWWYKDKTTGLIFQGGKVEVTSKTDFNVTFPKSFTSAPATVILTPYEQPTNAPTDKNYLASAININNLSFNIRYCDSDEGTNDVRRLGFVSWLAVGY